MGSGKIQVGFMLPGYLTSTDHLQKAINTRVILKSVTDALSVYPVLVHGSTQQAVLVATLGFDDTNKSDMQTLQMIGVWIRKTYVAIFLHAEITIEFLNISSRIGANNV
jgi:hypothetical protein